MFYISKLGKEAVNFKSILEEIKDEVKTGLVPLVIPLTKEEKTIGVTDVLASKAYSGEGEIEIPSEFENEIKQYKESMTEAISEVDEELMEKFVEEKEITGEDLKKVIAFKERITAERTILYENFSEPHELQKRVRQKIQKYLFDLKSAEEESQEEAQAKTKTASESTSVNKEKGQAKIPQRVPLA